MHKKMQRRPQAPLLLHRASPFFSYRNKGEALSAGTILKMQMIQNQEEQSKAENTVSGAESKPIQTSLVPVVIKSVSVPVQNDF